MSLPLNPEVVLATVSKLTSKNETKCVRILHGYNNVIQPLWSLILLAWTSNILWRALTSGRVVLIRVSKRPARINALGQDVYRNCYSHIIGYIAINVLVERLRKVGSTDYNYPLQLLKTVKRLLDIECLTTIILQTLTRPSLPTVDWGSFGSMDAVRKQLEPHPLHLAHQWTPHRVFSYELFLQTHKMTVKLCTNKFIQQLFMKLRIISQRDFHDYNTESDDVLHEYMYRLC